MTKLGGIQIMFKYKGIERQKTFIVVKNSANEVILEAYVKRSIDDAHDKTLGRFQAFKKAMAQLKEMGLATREQRKEAWEAYVEKINLPMKINLRRKIVVELIPAGL